MNIYKFIRMIPYNGSKHPVVMIKEQYYLLDGEVEHENEPISDVIKCYHFHYIKCRLFKTYPKNLLPGTYTISLANFGIISPSSVYELWKNDADGNPDTLLMAAPANGRNVQEAEKAALNFQYVLPDMMNEIARLKEWQELPDYDHVVSKAACKPCRDCDYNREHYFDYKKIPQACLRCKDLSHRAEAYNHHSLCLKK